MRIVFIGVGDSGNKDLPNTSILVLGNRNILLDCGFSAAQAFWKFSSDPELLDAAFISHQDADHVYAFQPSLPRFIMQDVRNH